MKKHLHEKLKITFQELGALLGTRAMLDTQLLPKTPKNHVSQYNLPDNRHEFNMNYACIRGGECGTVSCIGGTMALIMGEDPDDYVGKYGHGSIGGVFRTLFYPEVRGETLHSFATITAKQGVKAIDNFLQCGTPRWERVLTKAQLDEHRKYSYRRA